MIWNDVVKTFMIQLDECRIEYEEQLVQQVSNCKFAMLGNQ